MKLPNFVLKFFKKFKQNPKNIEYKRQNQIKTHFSMPKWEKGTLSPQLKILEKKTHSLQKFHHWFHEFAFKKTSSKYLLSIFFNVDIDKVIPSNIFVLPEQKSFSDKKILFWECSHIFFFQKEVLYSGLVYFFNSNFFFLSKPERMNPWQQFRRYWQ